jgi:hypothetical protein
MTESSPKRSGRRGTEVRRRQRRVVFRVTEAEYAQVEREASAAGLTVASFARSRTVAHATTRARRRPTVDILAVSRLLCVVNRMGVNLHIVARHLNFGGFPEAGEIRTALMGYEQMVQAIMTALGMWP